MTAHDIADLIVVAKSELVRAKTLVKELEQEIERHQEELEAEILD